MFIFYDKIIKYYNILNVACNTNQMKTIFNKINKMIFINNTNDLSTFKTYTVKKILLIKQ